MKQSFLGSERNGELMKTRIILLLTIISFATPQPLCGQVQGYNTVSRSARSSWEYVVVKKSNRQELRIFDTKRKAEEYIELLMTRNNSSNEDYKKEVEKQVAKCFGLSSTKGINARIATGQSQCASVPYDIITRRRTGVTNLTYSAAEVTADSETNRMTATYAPAVKPVRYVSATRLDNKVVRNVSALAVNRQSSPKQIEAGSIVRPDNMNNFSFVDKMIASGKYNIDVSVDDKARFVYSCYMRALKQEEWGKTMKASVAKAIAVNSSNSNTYLTEANAAVNQGDQAGHNDASKKIWIPTVEVAKDNSGHFWSDAVKDDAHRGKIFDKLVEVCTNPQSKEVDTQMLRRVVDYVDRDVKNAAARDKSSSPVVMPQDEDWEAVQRVLSVLRKECDENGLCQ